MTGYAVSSAAPFASILECETSQQAAAWQYEQYRDPPQRYKIQGKVMIGYVGFFYYNNESVGSRSADRQRWAGWIAAGAKRMFWRPNTLHAGDGMPYMYATAIARDFSWLGAHGLAATDFGVCFCLFCVGSIRFLAKARVHRQPHGPLE